MNILLDCFVSIKMSGYESPRRVGVSRGGKIGYSVQKRRAVFLCATDRSLKDIAGDVGVSYGLLRKWCCEKEFKTKRRDGILEFEDFKKDILEQFSEKELIGELCRKKGG